MFHQRSPCPGCVRFAGADDDQLLATGFEINLNNLKRTGKETMDVAGHIHANQVRVATSRDVTCWNTPHDVTLREASRPETWSVLSHHVILLVMQCKVIRQIT